MKQIRWLSVGLMLVLALIATPVPADLSEQARSAGAAVEAIESLGALVDIARLGSLIPEPTTAEELEEIGEDEELADESAERVREYVDSVLTLYGSSLLSERIESAEDAAEDLAQESEALEDVNPVELTLEEMVSQERRAEIRDEVEEALAAWRTAANFFERRQAALGEVASRAAEARELADATETALKKLLDDFGWAIAIATLGTAAAAEIFARAEQCSELYGAMNDVARSAADLQQRYAANLEVARVNIRTLEDLIE